MTETMADWLVNAVVTRSPATLSNERLGTVKKRYFRPTSTFVVIALRTLAMAWIAKPESDALMNGAVAPRWR